jgi:hypothetical protein
MLMDSSVFYLGILEHFQVMLKDAHQGYWKQGWPNQGNHSNKASEVNP